MFRWLLALALTVGVGFVVLGCGGEEAGPTTRPPKNAAAPAANAPAKPEAAPAAPAAPAKKEEKK